MRRSAFAATIVAALVASASRAPADQFGTVSGRLFDVRTNRPIVAANVYVFDPEGSEDRIVRTDARGRFNVIGLQAPTVLVQAEADGYEPFEGCRYALSPGGNTTLSIPLDRQGRIVGFSQTFCQDRIVTQGQTQDIYIVR